MNIKSKLWLLLLASLGALPINSSAFDLKSLSMVKNNTNSTALQVTAWSLGIIGAYHLINYSTKTLYSYAENKILDTLADSITLAFTPKLLLHRTVPTGKEVIALQKKARYIILRKEVLQKLNEILTNPQQLSEEHVKILRDILEKLKLSFNTIDALRLKTKYESSYQITWIDRYIIGYVVNSLIFATKPKHECTLNELKAKHAMLERRERLIKKLGADVITTIHVIFNPLFKDLNTSSWL